MVSKFTSDFFAGNRQRLRELFTGTAPIVLTAAGQLQRGGDMPFPFYQDASFWYFTGCDEPDVTLVLDKDKEYLIVPPRDDVRVTFEGAIDEMALKRVSGIDTVLDDREGWKKLGARLEKAKHVATLAAAPAFIDHYGMYTNPARRYLIRRMKTYHDGIELLDIGEHVARLRMVKQPLELEAIQCAIDITCQGLKRTLRPAKLRSYGFAYEVEAELTYNFRLAGVKGHAFTPVITAGLGACTMHTELDDIALSADELLLLDVGAEYDHYAADITRTVALGEPDKRQRAVYAAVLEVSDYAISLLKPGVLLKEYEKQVETFMGEKLRELGLIKTIELEIVRKFFPHAASHFMGLNPHDVGLYDQPLEPGVVLTIEPGIYIGSERLGVRVEDDLVITPEGNTILSKALPRMLA